jgi:5-methylcytosine-specific restriction endonuclease McrA
MTYIPADIRRLVYERAGGRCEYCRIHEDDRSTGHEIDHIIANKHGGETHEDNLCLACIDCNRHKGSDLSSLDPETKALTWLFNPRNASWSEHFQLNEATIEAFTPQGRATVFLLHLNDSERLQERATLIRLKRYP